MFLLENILEILRGIKDFFVGLHRYFSKEPVRPNMWRAICLLIWELIALFVSFLVLEPYIYDLIKSDIALNPSTIDIFVLFIGCIIFCLLNGIILIIRAALKDYNYSLSFNRYHIVFSFLAIPLIKYLIKFIWDHAPINLQNYLLRHE
jgi:hypothetical protein